MATTAENHQPMTQASTEKPLNVKPAPSTGAYRRPSPAVSRPRPATAIELIGEDKAKSFAAEQKKKARAALRRSRSRSLRIKPNGI